MKKLTKSNWQTIMFVIVAAFVFMFAASHSALAQGKFKVGDRVECDAMQIGKWEKGTILPYGDYDNPDSANYYRVRLDRNPNESGTICQFKVTRLSNEPAKKDETDKKDEPQEENPTPKNKDNGKLRVDENNTVLADRELLDCDNIEQKPTKNGARPDAKLLEKLIRCLYERPSEKGLDGARTVDLTPLQIGASRKWIPYQDIGSGGTPDTLVWAVKTTFTWRTFYRSRIEEVTSVGVFNCYVNTFGEWQCGSAGSKQKGETKNIPVQQ
jgi:hypothetical protein